MTPATAKRMASEAGLEFWYDRNERHWVIQDRDLMIDATYVAPGPLRNLTADQFADRYLAPQREALAKLKEDDQ